MFNYLHLEEIFYNITDSFLGDKNLTVLVEVRLL